MSWTFDIFKWLKYKGKHNVHFFNLGKNIDSLGDIAGIKCCIYI